MQMSKNPFNQFSYVSCSDIYFIYFCDSLQYEHVACMHAYPIISNQITGHCYSSCGIHSCTLSLSHTHSRTFICIYFIAFEYLTCVHFLPIPKSFTRLFVVCVFSFRCWYCFCLHLVLACRSPSHAHSYYWMLQHSVLIAQNVPNESTSSSNLNCQFVHRSLICVFILLLLSMGFI